MTSKWPSAITRMNLSNDDISLTQFIPLFYQRPHDNQMNWKRNMDHWKRNGSSTQFVRGRTPSLRLPVHAHWSDCVFFFNQNWWRGGQWLSKIIRFCRRTNWIDSINMLIHGIDNKQLSNDENSGLYWVRLRNSNWRNYTEIIRSLFIVHCGAVRSHYWQVAPNA